MQNYPSNVNSNSPEPNEAEIDPVFRTDDIDTTSSDPNIPSISDSQIPFDDQNLRDYVLSRDRVRRDIIPPLRYAYADFIAYALNIGDSIELDEPSSFDEEYSSKDSVQWIKAIKEERESLHKNKTWILVKRPVDQKGIGCRWIYKREAGIPGVEPARFKARVVAKGYSQREGIDYHEVFFPVVKHTSIRLVLAMVALYDLELEQLDVKTAFFHGNLKENLYGAAHGVCGKRQ